MKKPNRARLSGLLKSFKNKKVLVIGDVGVDRYTLGSVDRISPEAPVPIVLVQEEQLKLGLAANVADNIQALGGQALLTGVVGEDRCAEDFRKLLKAEKIKDSYLICEPKRRTVLKERVVSERQQLLRIDYENSEAISHQLESKILAMLKKLIAQCDAIILQDYAKGMITESLAKQVFEMAAEAGKWVAVDPNSKTPIHYYAGASILTPNTKEAEKLSGILIRDSKSLVAAGKFILKSTFAKNVVITRGKEGMAIFSAEGSAPELIPTYAREVYDVSGAGDTVIAVLALALSGGATVAEASILGNLAAGVEVGKRGTATVTPAEVLEAMEFFGY